MQQCAWGRGEEEEEEKKTSNHLHFLSGEELISVSGPCHGVKRFFLSGGSWRVFILFVKTSSLYRKRV